MKKVFIFILFATQFSFSNTKNNDLFASSENLFEMSFEELLNVNVVSSSFIAVDKIKEPASVTTITAEDIAVTPFRNLYDLLEVYVPGAIWMTHYDSPHIGIRGIINQRNDKILLLVNGKNMNFKAHNGATSELENWDLSDIEKIEIIRGPGSVIYGPGAVEAIINIKTKEYTNEGLNIKLGSTYTYNSYAGNIQFSHQFSDDIKLYAFGSITSTKGLSPKNGYFISSNDYLFDLPVNDPNLRPFQDLFVDSELKPQIKALINLELGENTSIWARYTNSGTIVNGITFKLSYQNGFDSLGNPTTGNPTNFNQAKNEQFVLGLNHNLNIGNNYNLKTFLCFDSENNSRSMDYIQVHPKAWAAPEKIMDMLADPNSLRNRYYACSETELQLRTLLTKDFENDWKIAFGFEYSYNYWGQSWFHNDGFLRLGDNWNILTDSNSPAYGWKNYFGTDSNDTYFVGDGWGTNTISVFGEVNYSILDNFTFIGSARLDKDDYSNLMFSPRFALIYGFNESNYLKFIVQRSLRMNTAEELFIQYSRGIKPEEEQIHNAELIFTRLENTNFIINISTFISWLEVLTWKDDIRSTILSGRLNIAGLEIETKYHNTFLDITLNHSYIKQLSWKLEPGVNQSGVSYSDYFSSVNGGTFTSNGNDLNNWSNNVTKFIINFNIIDNELLLHIDSRLYWGFQGAQDGVEMMRNSLSKIEDSISLGKIIRLIDKYDSFSPDFRLNASINYTIFKDFTIFVNGMNLLDLTNNKRFKYDTGSKEEKWNYYFKTSTIFEPISINLGINYKF